MPGCQTTRPDQRRQRRFATRGARAGILALSLRLKVSSHSSGWPHRWSSAQVLNVECPVLNSEHRIRKHSTFDVGSSMFDVHSCARWLSDKAFDVGPPH